MCDHQEPALAADTTNLVSLQASICLVDWQNAGYIVYFYFNEAVNGLLAYYCSYHEADDHSFSRIILKVDPRALSKRRLSGKCPGLCPWSWHDEPVLFCFFYQQLSWRYKKTMLIRAVNGRLRPEMREESSNSWRGKGLLCEHLLYLRYTLVCTGMCVHPCSSFSKWYLVGLGGHQCRYAELSSGRERCKTAVLLAMIIAIYRTSTMCQTVKQAVQKRVNRAGPYP